MLAPNPTSGLSLRAISVRERLSVGDRTAAEDEQIGSLLIEGNAERQLANLPAAVAAHEKALKLTRADTLGVQARLELARDALRLNRPKDAQRLLADAATSVRANWGTLAPQIELERGRAFSLAGEHDAARTLLTALRGRFAAAGQPARRKSCGLVCATGVRSATTSARRKRCAT